MKKLIFIGLILVQPLFAYLDPGTGSMLLSSIIALIATIAYSAKNFFYKIITLPSKILGKQISYEKELDIVFYNEGNQYFSTFYPILNEMQKRGIPFTYIYSDEDDLIPQKMKSIDSHYIGMGNKAFFYLNTIEANMVIMTTPGLDVLQIKRSKGVKHYCNIHHATRGLAGYKVFSFDCFDSLLVPNKIDKIFFRDLENVRNLPKKDIKVVGTPYLDFLKDKKENINIDKLTTKTVLISPTWGEQGLLYRYGDELLSKLTDEDGINIIVRPHPQDIKYKKDMLNNLENKYLETGKVTWDYENDGFLSMAKADIMISDFSGIVFDFIFLFNKTVITMPSQFNYDGKDYISREEPYWFMKFYENSTVILDEKDVSNINDIVNESLGNKNQSTLSKEIMEEYNPYFGESGKKCVDEIESLYQEVLKGETK